MIMKTFIFRRGVILGLCFNLLMICSSHAQSYSIKLSEDLSLKELFDSGLRPTNVYQAQFVKCEVNDADFALALDSVTLNFNAAKATFHISSDNNVSEAEFVSRNLSLEDAYSQAVQIFSTFGGAPNNLEEAFREVQKSRSFAPLREIGVRASKKEPEVRIFFLAGDFNPASPEDKYVRIALSAYWMEKAQNRKSLRKQPIEPPPGYESFDMAPVLTANQERLVNERESHDGSPKKTQSSFIESPASSPDSAKETTPAEVAAVPERGFPIIPVAVIAALLAAGVVFILRRKKP